METMENKQERKQQEKVPKIHTRADSTAGIRKQNFNSSTLKYNSDSDKGVSTQNTLSTPFLTCSQSLWVTYSVKATYKVYSPQQAPLFPNLTATNSVKQTQIRWFHPISPLLFWLSWNPTYTVVLTPAHRGAKTSCPVIYRATGSPTRWWTMKWHNHMPGLSRVPAKLPSDAISTRLKPGLQILSSMILSVKSTILYQIIIVLFWYSSLWQISGFKRRQTWQTLWSSRCRFWSFLNCNSRQRPSHPVGFETTDVFLPDAPHPCVSRHT